MVPEASSSLQNAAALFFLAKACFPCHYPVSGSRHWSDLRDRLFPVASVVLLLGQGRDDGPSVLSRLHHE